MRRCLRSLAHTIPEALHFNQPGAHVFNLGAGKPISVMQLGASLSDLSSLFTALQSTVWPRLRGATSPTSSPRDGTAIFLYAVRVVPSPSDLPPQRMWADVTKAQRLLQWRATRTLEDMCRDGWAWAKSNPRGYDG